MQLTDYVTLANQSKSRDAAENHPLNRIQYLVVSSSGATLLALPITQRRPSNMYRTILRFRTLKFEFPLGVVVGSFFDHRLAMT